MFTYINQTTGQQGLVHSYPASIQYPSPPIHFSTIPSIANNLRQSLFNPYLLKPAHDQRKVLPLIILIICTKIEISGILFTLFNSSLFEYCYWEFGLWSYSKTTHQSLSNANSYGKVSKLYKELQCRNKNKFPECPDLCSLAKDLKFSAKVFWCGAVASGVITVLVLLVFFVRFLKKKQEISRFGVGVLMFSSVFVFLAAGCGFWMESGMGGVEEVTSVGNGDDQPKDLGIGDGGIVLILLIGFMVFYRTVLVVLAK